MLEHNEDGLTKRMRHCSLPSSPTLRRIMGASTLGNQQVVESPKSRGLVLVLARDSDAAAWVLHQTSMWQPKQHRPSSNT
jgi:hypothetical protein